MANSSNAEFLEAEAATVLSNMAAEGSIDLCTASVFQSIAKLLKTNLGLLKPNMTGSLQFRNPIQHKVSVNMREQCAFSFGTYRSRKVGELVM